MPDSAERFPHLYGEITLDSLAAVRLLIPRCDGYPGLHQLCGNMLDRLERLPTPQRLALEVVFGLSAGAAPDHLRFVARRLLAESVGLVFAVREVGDQLRQLPILE